jgi:hypothetical protein
LLFLFKCASACLQAKVSLILGFWDNWIFTKSGCQPHSYPPYWKTDTTPKSCRTWLVSLATRLPPAWFSCSLEEDFLEGSNFRNHRTNIILVVTKMKLPYSTCTETRMIKLCAKETWWLEFLIRLSKTFFDKITKGIHAIFFCLSCVRSVGRLNLKGVLQ